MMDGIELARWQGGVDHKLDTLLTRLDQVAHGKDTDHVALHQRIDSTDHRVDRLESRWDRALGAAIGIGIGAGAVGGGVGAFVSSLIGA